MLDYGQEPRRDTNWYAVGSCAFATVSLACLAVRAGSRYISPPTYYVQMGTVTASLILVILGLYRRDLKAFVSIFSIIFVGLMVLLSALTAFRY